MQDKNCFDLNVNIMKSNLLICFVIICILASLCIYQTIKKEDIYISFKDLNGFKYQFIDSTDVLKTGKVLINQEGKFKNHFWEINIDWGIGNGVIVRLDFVRLEDHQFSFRKTKDRSNFG